MKQPVIVYIITKMELGGAQKVCISLFEDLKKKYQTYLITGTEGVLVPTIAKQEGTVLLPSLTREVSASGILSECKAFIDLIKTLRRLKKKYPDLIVHTHSSKAGILGRWAAFFARIPQRVHTVHGYGFHPHQRWIPWLAIYGCELITSFITTHFVCVSEYDQNTGSRLFPFFRKKSSLIRAAVDHTNFIPVQKATSDTFIFGTVACFKPQKNIFDLLQAFLIVSQSNPRAHLEIIGDGTLKPLIQEWIRAHNLEDVITLHGWQQHVAPIMKTWDAFVLSSLWEGLPCAVIEARLLKLPVISYITGGIPEVIMHEHNGLLCAQKNVSLLAQHMSRMLRDSELYTQLSSYQDNLTPFYRDSMVMEHDKLYQKLLS